MSIGLQSGGISCIGRELCTVVEELGATVTVNLKHAERLRQVTFHRAFLGGSYDC